MVFLLFQLGVERYAIDVMRVERVIPLVRIKRIPRAPAEVAGALDYRGAPVPVIDLCRLAIGEPAPQRLGTRIMLVPYADAHGAARLLGLIAENVTAILRREPAQFRDAGVNDVRAPFLGPVTLDARGMIQRIEVERLLPPPLRDLLFRPAREAR